MKQPELWVALLLRLSSLYLSLLAFLISFYIIVFLWRQPQESSTEQRTDSRQQTADNNKQQPTSLTTNCRQILMQQIIINEAATASLHLRTMCQTPHAFHTMRCLLSLSLAPSHSLSLSRFLSATQFQLKLTDCTQTHLNPRTHTYMQAFFI